MSNLETAPKSFAKFHSFSPDEFADRIGIEHYLNGVAVNKFNPNKEVIETLGTSEALLPFPAQGVFISRVSCSRRGALISASGEISREAILAFGNFDPNAKCFHNGHYSKLFASVPPSNGVVGYYTSLARISKPVIHRIVSNGSFRLLALDFLQMPDNPIITAIGAPFDGGPNQVYNLANAEDLGKEFDFAPNWVLNDWSKGRNIVAIEGFPDGQGRCAFVATEKLDSDRNRLVKVIGGTVSPVLEERPDSPDAPPPDTNIVIQFRPTTGAELHKDHLVSVMTRKRLIELSSVSNGKMDIQVSNFLMTQNHKVLEDMVKQVDEQDPSDWIQSSAGFYHLKNMPEGMVLAFWPRPQNL